MSERVAIFVNDMTIGGLSRAAINLSIGFRQVGYEVDIILVDAYGDLLSDVPSSVGIVELDSGKVNLRRSMRTYLSTQSPDRLYSITAHYIPLQASVFSRTDVSIYLVQETVRSGRSLGLKKYLKYRLTENPLFSLTEGVIATSEDVARDISDFAPVDFSEIDVVGNPIDIERIRDFSSAPADHPFYRSDEPLILGAGHLRELKDYATLIRSMSLLLCERNANLLVLGEGDRRGHLNELARSLSIEDHVDIVDFVNNPYPYMGGADVFVHPSRSEGFGNVIVEALACGTPAVVTDCPGGPSEIVDSPHYGGVVSVGDHERMAEEISRLLVDPPSPVDVVSRAENYSIASVVEQYEAIHDVNDTLNRGLGEFFSL